MRKTDLIIITNEHFPEGLAATNRIKSYVCPIAERKDVLLLTFAWPNISNSVRNKVGHYKKVKYVYVDSPNIKKQRSKIYNMLCRYIGIVKLLILLLFIFETKTVLLYCSRSPISLFVKIICLIKKQKMYIDITETSENKGYFKKKFFDLRAKIFDGIIVISKEMKEYFSFVNKDRLFYLPICLDAERFGCIACSKEKYFAYCSGGNLKRDGLIDGIKGFLMFAEEYPSYKLKIAAKINLKDSYSSEVFDLICKNKEKINYVGLLSSSDVVNFLTHATALLITPHTNYLTKGFPTKIGEYLSSYSPVICTSIQDLEENLEKDCVYMVTPNSPSEICSAMVSIVKDPNKAQVIAKNARTFVERNHSINLFEDELIKFLCIE